MLKELLNRDNPYLVFRDSKNHEYVHNLMKYDFKKFKELMSYHYKRRVRSNINITRYRYGINSFRWIDLVFSVSFDHAFRDGNMKAVNFMFGLYPFSDKFGPIHQPQVQYPKKSIMIKK